MTLTNTQETTLSISPTNRKGQPATVENVVWATSNSEVVGVEAAADGLSCRAFAIGPLGSATVSVTAYGHVGEGEFPLAGTLDIDVTAADAVSLTVAASDPTEQP